MFEILQIGPLIIRVHLIFLFTGIVIGTNLFFRLAGRDGLRLTVFLKKGWWFLFAFLVGGRLLGMLLLYRVYMQDPARIPIFWDGVFNTSGGLFGIAVALLVFTRRQRSQFLRWTDVLFPSSLVIMAFDWIGRFFGSMSYGKPTDMFWGVTLNSMSVRYTVPIHPVQIYYAVWFLVTAFFLLTIKKRKHADFFSYVALPAKYGAGVRKMLKIPVTGSGAATMIGAILSFGAVTVLEFYRGDFAITVFARLIDFVFLGVLFASLGTIAVIGKRISRNQSLVNSIGVGIVTIIYLLVRPRISVFAVEWRFSQFLAVLAIIASIVYVVVHRWKYSDN